MAKKLTKAEIHYIKSNPDGLSEEQMAEELEISISSVKKYYVKVQKEQIPQSEDVFKLMGRRTEGKNKGGIVVMTRPASELADATRENRTMNIKESLKNAIHRPKGNNHVS